MKKLGTLVAKNQFLTTVVCVIAGWFLFEIQSILIALFIAYITMAALVPFVDILVTGKVPRPIAVFASFLTTLCVVIMLVVPLIPFFSSQLQTLFERLPFYMNDAARTLGISIHQSDISNFIGSEIGAISQNAFTLTGKVLGGLFSLVSIFVMSFYMLLERNTLIKKSIAFFPESQREELYVIVLKVEEKLGAWVRGQIVLCVAIGITTWIGLVMLGVPYALPLALIAGILEVIPTIGPLVSSVPAIIVALTISPSLGVLVAGMYIAVQMLENHILVPQIMKKAVGLNPLIIIVTVLIGSKLLGVMGALLSVPFLAMIVSISSSVHHAKNQQ